MENWPEARSWARGVLRWVSVALSQSAVRVAWQDGLRCSVSAGALGGLPARAGALGGGGCSGLGFRFPRGGFLVRGSLGGPRGGGAGGAAGGASPGGQRASGTVPEAWVSWATQCCPSMKSKNCGSPQLWGSVKQRVWTVWLKVWRSKSGRWKMCSRGLMRHQSGSVLSLRWRPSWSK